MESGDLAQLLKNAELDQAMTALANMAHASWMFFQELRTQGFTQKQAFDMVLQWQEVMFLAASQGNNSGGKE